jgi:hypothetical protein
MNTATTVKCQDCGERRRILRYGRCGECLTFLDTCAECGGNFRGHPFIGQDPETALYHHTFVAQQREAVS